MWRFCCLAEETDPGPPSQRERGAKEAARGLSGLKTQPCQWLEPEGGISVGQDQAPTINSQGPSGPYRSLLDGHCCWGLANMSSTSRMHLLSSPLAARIAVRATASTGVGLVKARSRSGTLARALAGGRAQSFINGRGCIPLLKHPEATNLETLGDKQRLFPPKNIACMYPNPNFT